VLPAANGGLNPIVQIFRAAANGEFVETNKLVTELLAIFYPTSTSMPSYLGLRLMNLAGLIH
jgi:hypothetical protein